MTKKVWPDISKKVSSVKYICVASGDACYRLIDAMVTEATIISCHPTASP